MHRKRQAKMQSKQRQKNLQPPIQAVKYKLNPIQPLISVSCLFLNLSPRCLDRTIDFSTALGHGAAHFARQDVPEPGERQALPVQVLITALDKLDELTGVDVWVAGGVDVVDDLWGELNVGEQRVGGVGFW